MFSLLIDLYLYILIIMFYITASFIILLLIQLIFYKVFNINLYKLINKFLFK